MNPNSEKLSPSGHTWGWGERTCGCKTLLCNYYLLSFLGDGGGSFHWWLSGKESAANAEDTGSLPGLGRSSGEGNGNPFQHSCLENPMERGNWQATVLGGHKRVGHDLVTKTTFFLLAF